MSACLIAAALWAIATAIFRDLIDHHGPHAVNLFKCAFSAVCFLLLTLVLGGFEAPANPSDLGWLAFSGVIGLSVGDTLLFVSMREGGLQRALVLFNSAPIFAILIGAAVYGTLPTSTEMAGIALVLTGVILVETDPVRLRKSRASPANRPTLALFAGLGAAAGQATGIVLSHGPLQNVGVIPASAVRITAAAVGILVIGLISRRARAGFSSLVPRRWPPLILASSIGSVIAIYFMMIGMRDVPPGISATLLSTTPLFSLPLARFFLKEQMGWRTALGTVVAVVGVAWLSL